jgi:undecaprenyl diphosphate synthase
MRGSSTSSRRSWMSPRAPNATLHSLGSGIHVAVIMDGNGRWATARGLDRTAGHAAGEIAVTSIVEAAVAEQVEWLTLFAFSTENWNRPQAEVDFLMEFNRALIARHGADYHSRNIRVRYLGEAERIPQSVVKAMKGVERLTESNTGLKLTFAFNHGGRAEIVEATRSLIATGCKADDVSEELFAEYLPVPEMPDPDLIIRTSGEFRISNFLLWRAAYAELVFLDVFWPDFRGRHLRDALDTYQSRSRRFGAIEDAFSPALVSGDVR